MPGASRKLIQHLLLYGWFLWAVSMKLWGGGNIFLSFSLPEIDVWIVPVRKMAFRGVSLYRGNTTLFFALFSHSCLPGCCGCWLSISRSSLSELLDTETLIVLRQGIIPLLNKGGCSQALPCAYTLAKEACSDVECSALEESNSVRWFLQFAILPFFLLPAWNLSLQLLLFSTNVDPKVTLTMR